ncbi:MAG: AAA family ATPase [Anaerolineae bacterium]|nr:AAA family ATPase [Anaerolineae bacterium]
MTLFETAPYRNLILTGPMAAGKTSIGRAVARRLKADFYDLETEILAREGQPPDEIRELFGEARLNTLEAEAIRDLTLRRSAVLTVPGPAVLDEANRTRLAESGSILCLKCALNEALRRLHMARGAWFHSPYNRAVLLSRLKRDWRVLNLDLPKLDNTWLSVEQTTEAVIAFWFEHAEL